MPPRRISLKNLPERERPRERLIQKGSGTLTDSELLAIILGSGTKAESAVQLAQRLLKESGAFRALEEMSVNEMCRKFHGVGPARAAQVKAALEIARRYSNELTQTKARFSNSSRVFSHYKDTFIGKRHEEFWVLSLDAKNALRNEAVISRGTLMGSIVHAREVFRAAIENSAAGIIVLHNHPSGDPEPSPEDRRVTQQLAEAGKLLGIPLLDHLVIGNSSYFSFKDMGLL